MASPLRSLLLLAFLSSALLATALDHAGRKPDGRTEIQDVASNEEVQDLGWFAVMQYNDGLLRSRAGVPLLKFLSVVSGQQQAVKSGVKYYLRVAVTVDGIADAEKARRMYDAVVVVHTSQGGFRSLVTFKPRSYRPAHENNF